MQKFEFSFKSIDRATPRNLSNTSLYPIVGQTKTKKILLTGLETKHNVVVLWHYIIQFLIEKTQGYNILFNSANKKMIYILSIPVIR